MPRLLLVVPPCLALLTVMPSCTSTGVPCNHDSDCPGGETCQAQVCTVRLTAGDAGEPGTDGSSGTGGGGTGGGGTGGSGNSNGTCAGCSPGQTCNSSGACVGGTPTSLAAKAVGGWMQVGSCSGSYPRSQFGIFLCPGGKIRGGGYVGSIVELVCGTYAVSPPAKSGCTDRLGCFPRIDSTVKDTLTSGGVSDVENGYQFSMYHLSANGSEELRWPCPGSSDQAVLRRVSGAVTDNYCVSSACPGTSTPAGCGTDCDCGRCWYCEKSGGTGTCRYGGEGPYGCYRGCGD